MTIRAVDAKPGSALAGLLQCREDRDALLAAVAECDQEIKRLHARIERVA